MLHALSFDVEEFFHVANLRGHYDRADWDGVESRLDVGMDAVLGALARHGAHATFFWLGWMAEQRPDLVRRCLDEGHEVASHGYEHAFLWDLGPDGLEQDLERTEAALIAAGAPSPVGFRASTFTLTRDTWWAFDILARRGYQYDSSVHPIRHPVYGVPDFEPGISMVETDGGARMLEFPVSTLKVAGRNVPVGGGGYFRLYPGALTRAAVARLEAAGTPASIYLHPWEFDPGQPRIPAPPLKKFRHYLNLSRTLPRLERLIERFEFRSLSEVLAHAGYGELVGGQLRLAAVPVDGPR